MTYLTQVSRSMVAYKTDQPTGLGWSLWTFAASLPWFIPTHSNPWTTFHNEVAMALVMLPIALWAVWGIKCAWKVDVLAAGFALTSLIPLVQSKFGVFKIPTEAPLVTQYLVAIALLLLVARHAEQAAPYRLIDSLFGGLLIASLLSTGMALYQWLGLQDVSVLLAPMTDRPFANVGQPNNLATMLVWGLVAIWWGFKRKWVCGFVAVFAAAFLMMGVRLTQSRVGLLEVCALFAAAVLARRQLKTSDQLPASAVLGVWFVICLVAFDPLSRLLSPQATRALEDMGSPQERTVLLKMVLTAIHEHPWLGYGWNQNVTAHVALAKQIPMHGTIGNAHNIMLDLMMWNGIPMAIALAAGLCFWFYKASWRPRTAEHVLVVMALVVLIIHTMLELPHLLAYFLFPAAIMMGTLNAWRPPKTLFQLNRGVIGLCIVAMGVLLVVECDDYLQIEARAINAAKFDARIANVQVLPEPKPLVLVSLQDALKTLRTAPVRGMNVADLDHMRATVTRYPTISGLFRYAEASALNHRPEEAQWSLTVLCALNPVAVCKEAVDGWAAEGAGDKPEIASVEFPRGPWMLPRGY